MTEQPSEAEKLRQWFEREKAEKGLIDVKFFRIPSENSTLESFCAEVNYALNAPVLNDNGAI